MSRVDQTKPYFNTTPVSAVNVKPAAPFAARQAIMDRRLPDPSSVQRSDRYPIPTFFEYRMRAGQ